MRVKKAVIPAAGLGTRFLPATKSQPKEMLPIVDKPAIQYVVEQAVHAGLEDILIITGRGKRTIEDHFDRSFELEWRLEQAGKHDELKEVRAVTEMATVHYIRQKDPRGLGAAVSLAEDHVAGEPFVVMLGDDIMLSGNVVSDMLEVYNRYGRSVICGMEVPRSEVHLYGTIQPETPPDKTGEVQLTDAINLLAQQQTVYAYLFEGIRYDIGKKLDYLRAVVELAIDREDLGPGFRAVLADLVQRKKLL